MSWRTYVSLESSPQGEDVVLTSGRRVTIPVPRGKKSLPTRFYSVSMSRTIIRREELEAPRAHYSCRYSDFRAHRSAGGLSGTQKNRRRRRHLVAC